jgi:hypothetical protein
MAVFSALLCLSHSTAVFLTRTTNFRWLPLFVLPRMTCCLLSLYPRVLFYLSSTGHGNLFGYLRFYVLTVVNMSVLILWIVTPRGRLSIQRCLDLRIQCFGQTHSLHLQDWSAEVYKTLQPNTTTSIHLVVIFLRKA